MVRHEANYSSIGALILPAVVTEEISVGQTKRKTFELFRSCLVVNLYPMAYHLKSCHEPGLTC